jgi:predicted transcriptional regulator
MNERLSVPLPADLAAWLKREAERQERPVAYVTRKAIEAARREAQADRVAA